MPNLKDAVFEQISLELAGEILMCQNCTSHMFCEKHTQEIDQQLNLIKTLEASPRSEEDNM